MRRGTELSTYNRAVAFSKQVDGEALTKSALAALAQNEAQMLYLFSRWAGATDVGYTMHGCKKRGDAFKLPTREQVDFALRFMK